MRKATKVTVLMPSGAMGHSKLDDKIEIAELQKLIIKTETEIAYKEYYLQKLQFEYLNNVGFEIEKLDTQFSYVETYIYKHGEKVFLDIEDALEYAFGLCA